MTTNHPTQSDSNQSTDTGQSSTVMYISEEEFDKWTGLWKTTMSDSHSSLKDLFTDTVNKGRDYLQLGVGFKSQSILDFLSTVGLYTIFVRFGYDKEGSNKFKIILFGRDRQGNIVTPYMVGYPLYDTITNLIKDIDKYKDKLGEVPIPLAKKWIQNWKDMGRNASPAMFNISNSNGNQALQGYAYQMRELLNTLFMDEKTNEMYAILGLHQYPAREPSSVHRSSVAYTFGLLLLGIHNNKPPKPDNNETAPNRLTNHFIVEEELEVTAVYYDFSAPCPGTC